jgi:hypothetical protein
MDETFSIFLDRLAIYLDKRAEFRNRRMLPHQARELDKARLNAQIGFHELMVEALESGEPIMDLAQNKNGPLRTP